MKRRTETIIETHQVQVIRRRGRERQGWCESCAATVRMIGLEAAAMLAQVTVRAVFRRVEAGELHFTETPQGALLICLPSFNAAQFFESDKSELPAGETIVDCGLRIDEAFLFFNPQSFQDARRSSVIADGQHTNYQCIAMSTEGVRRCTDH